MNNNEIQLEILKELRRIRWLLDSYKCGRSNAGTLENVYENRASE